MPTSATSRNEFLSCSFRGKSQRQVAKLIAGPGVYICDECIGLCNEILEEELIRPTGDEPTATEERLAWRRWIDGPIKDDVAAMHARRHAWAAGQRPLDRHLARAAAAAAEPPTEIHEAIDLIGAVFQRYPRLLMGSPPPTPPTEDDPAGGSP